MIPVSRSGSQHVPEDPNVLQGIPISLSGSQRVPDDPRTPQWVPACPRRSQYPSSGPRGPSGAPGPSPPSVPAETRPGPAERAGRADKGAGRGRDRGTAGPGAPPSGTASLPTTPGNSEKHRGTPGNTGDRPGKQRGHGREAPQSSGALGVRRGLRGTGRGGDTKTPRVRGFLEGKQAKAEIPRLEGGRGWKGFLFPAPKGAPGALRGSLVKGVECGTKGDGCELQEGRFMWDFGEEIPPCDGKEGLAQVSSWLSHPWQCPGPAWPGLGAAEIMDGVPAHPWGILGPFPNHP